ncbi:MAG: outer membrane protein transport protein [Myxococcota bacterium]|nr:outer membrane protein transport protein [Myxococcota bacterium]
MLIFCFSAVWGSPIELYGFGSRNLGLANTGAARAGIESFSLNPAAGIGEMQFLLGYSWLRSSFTEPPMVAWDSNQDGFIDGLDDPIQPPWDYDDSDGLSLGMLHPLGKRMHFGFNLYLPTNRILQIRTYDTAFPHWILYRERPYGYGLISGVNVRIYDGLYVGIGSELAYKARVRLSGTLDASLQAGDEEISTQAMLDIHEIQLDAVPASAFFFGVFWESQSIEGLTVGASYRSALSNPIDVDLDLQINLGVNEFAGLDEIDFTLVAPVKLSLLDYYKPARFRFETSYTNWKPLQVSVGLEWTGWSDAFLNTAQVVEGTVQIPILFSEPTSLDDGNSYQVELQDTWSVHMGLESELSTFGRPILLRGGWGYVSTALKNYGSNVSPLDSPRQFFSAGVGMTHLLPIDLGPLTWDFFGQYHIFAPGFIEVDYDSAYTPGAPVESEIPIGGSLLAVGFQTRMEY